MDSIARFRCPHCLQMTTFCPKVHEAVFGATSNAPSRTTYQVTCRYCRRSSLFAVDRPWTALPTESEAPDT